MSNIKNDLSLFNELAETLIKEEQKNPVAERIEADKLYESIDLSLDQTGMINDDFKALLSEILVATPKQQRIYFLINYLVVDKVKQFLVIY